MAKTITIELSDAEFTNLQKAYSIDDGNATEDYIKAKLVNVLKAAMRLYDEKNARKSISYTSFDPK